MKGVHGVEEMYGGGGIILQRLNWAILKLLTWEGAQNTEDRRVCLVGAEERLHGRRAT